MQSLRTDQPIDDTIEINWSAKTYNENPFVLAYDGNPYDSHTIVVDLEGIVFEDSNLSLNDGDVLGIFTNNGLCVGYEVVGEGTWPQLKASKNDGTGNGFTENASAYFKIWQSATGHVSTVIESKVNGGGQLSLCGNCGADEISLSIKIDDYNLYRNGALIASEINDTVYLDDSLESGFQYSYVVSSSNFLNIELLPSPGISTAGISPIRIAQRKIGPSIISVNRLKTTAASQAMSDQSAAGRKKKSIARLPKVVTNPGQLISINCLREFVRESKLKRKGE